MNNWKVYSPAEWLMVDIASRYGMDKEHFDVRIQWVANELLPLARLAENFDMFKELMAPYIEEADEQPMFCGALIGLWDALQGKESTWQVGQDAASSGPQLLSVLLKDVIGMRNTGVLGTAVPDLYTTCTDHMNDLGKGTIFERKIVKKGIVPHVYASSAAPKRVFKKAYPTFLKAYKATVPMAQEASDIMVKAWNPNAVEHCWLMPDAAVIRVPVIVQRKKTLKCGKHSFEYVYDELGTKDHGELGAKSLSANTTHSYDAYMLRELNRRCNYNRARTLRCARLLTKALEHKGDKPKCEPTDHLLLLESLAFRFNQASAVALEYIDEANVYHLQKEYILMLLDIIEGMVAHEPFEVTNIHDEFKTLPKHVTDMKIHYNELLVETYYSTWWFETAKTLTGTDFSFMATEPDPIIAEQIKDAAYSIG